MIYILFVTPSSIIALKNEDTYYYYLQIEFKKSERLYRTVRLNPNFGVNLGINQILGKNSNNVALKTKIYPLLLLANRK